MKHECGHDVEMMGVAVPGGWSEFPMRCLECYAAWIEQKRCCDCGDDAAPGCVITMRGEENGKDFARPYHFCRRHWMDAIRPQRCERCGRFAGADADTVDLGEEPATHDPYWGHQPPEPVVAWWCGKCRKCEHVGRSEAEPCGAQEGRSG